MLSYIASENTSRLIHKVCKNKNVLILYETEEKIDINKYLKETKINFNLIKYFIIEIECLDNSSKDIVENICNIKKLHTNIRIIILAQGMDAQNELLNQLYNYDIYNIINFKDELEIEQQLLKAISDKGIQKHEASNFRKSEEIKTRNTNFKKFIKFMFNKKINLNILPTKIINQKYTSNYRCIFLFSFFGIYYSSN